ncbi:MAG: family 43 glycosylhydrolase, partial [Hyphomonas sp.]
VTFQPVSAPVMIINGGARPEDKPIWIEGPHIYKVGETYLFSAAEGGTAVGHSQVAFKAESVYGPYIPYTDNPILTQRDLPDDRLNPVTSVGHADFVQDSAGRWWASFLGVRPYQGDDYNTGRETFLLPVTWQDGWPIILESGEPLPLRQQRPDLPAQPAAPVPTSGNFTLTEEFEGETLPPYWMAVRIPKQQWHSLEHGTLRITPRGESLGSGKQPSFLARRQQHTNAEASTELVFAPQAPKDEAGIAAFQNDDFFYALGVGLNDAGERVVRLRKKSGPDMEDNGEILAEIPVSPDPELPVRLKIAARGASYDFYAASGDSAWQSVATGQDGSILSTRAAGGFVGAVFGMYAQSAAE